MDSGERSRLDAEWAQLQQEKEQFLHEKEKFRLEREEFEHEKAELGIEYKLFAGNLDENTTEADLTPIFEQHGSLKELVVIRDRVGKSKRSAFITYHSRKAAEACVEKLNGIYQDGNSKQMMVVRKANRGNTPQGGNKMLGVFPSNMYGGTGGYGQVAMNYNDGNNTGNLGFNRQQITGPYGVQAGYGNGAGYNHSSGGGSAPVGVGALNSGAAVVSPVVKGPAGCNLYVNNLSKGCSEHALGAMFKEYGNVVSVKVFPENCYGFVSFDNPTSALNAIENLHGMDISGNEARRLEVSLKTQKKKVLTNTRYSPY